MSFRPDAAQTLAITLPAGRALLLTGEAGVGKTTVAMHRLAALAHAAGRPVRALVLTPTQALADKCWHLLRELGVDAEVSTTQAWIAREARRAFPDLSDKDSERATPSVIRVKRHPSVREVLQWVAETSDDRVGRGDLHELWGDRNTLRDLVDSAEGALSDSDTDEVYAHAEIQFSDVDTDSEGNLLLAFDGLPLHAGTPRHDAATQDIEDLPVLFELDQLRGGEHGPTQYDHLMVDEVQELAPMELALLGRAVSRGGTLIAAGDDGQQVDTTAWFEGFDTTVVELGAAEASHVHLAQSYRCPPEIVAVARRLRAGEAMAPVDSETVASTLFDDDAARTAALVATLEGRRSCAVVVRAPETARRLWRQLRGPLGARLALSASKVVGGLTVTTPEHLRGLELEHVVVPDLDPVGWPDGGPSRRALYLAVTRASKSLWLGTVGSWSPLVRSAV